MRTITNAQLIAANRAALADGTLAALAPEPRCEYLCRQHGRTYHCAIGCALTEEELNAIPPDKIDKQWWKIDFPVIFEDETFAIKLQNQHDQWCFGAADKKEYLALINPW